MPRTIQLAIKNKSITVCRLSKQPDQLWQKQKESERELENLFHSLLHSILDKKTNMSISSLISSINSVDKEIHNYQQQINSLDNRIASKQKEATSILDRISREKDLKKIVQLNKDLTRKNEEITNIEKDRSGKERSLADKRKRRGELQVQLGKEEQKERENTKKEQERILSVQQEISREMERQRFLSRQSLNWLKPVTVTKQYHVFVSHASEDKEDFVRPFVNALVAEGLSVWYDEFELKVGDSLRRSIDNGLKNSKYGIVVLSEHFFKKEWPQKELDGLFAKESNGERVILPLWHKISKNEVLNYSPMIADIKALNTSDFTYEELAKEIAKVILR